MSSTLAVDKVLRNTGATLSVTWYVDGVATDADGDVTVTVTDDGGNTLASAVTAADATPGDGKYEWVLSPQSDLKFLTLSWSGDFGGVTHTATTYAEVVHNFLFSVADARSHNGSKLSDTSKYPTAMIVDLREEITEMLYKITNVSFVQRYGRAELDGTGNAIIYLPDLEVRTLQSVTVDGTSLATSNVTVYPESGRLLRQDATWPTNADGRNVIVEYEYGTRFVPADIARTALMLLEHLILSSDISSRAITHQSDIGVIRYSMPDNMKQRPTGIPWVDAVLDRYTDSWGVV